MKFKVSYTSTYLTITTSSYCVCSMSSITSQEVVAGHIILNINCFLLWKEGHKIMQIAVLGLCDMRFILKNTTFCSTHLCSFGYPVQFQALAWRKIPSNSQVPGKRIDKNCHMFKNYNLQGDWEGPSGEDWGDTPHLTSNIFKHIKDCRQKKLLSGSLVDER